MKQNYVCPEIELISLSSEDICAASGVDANIDGNPLFAY